MNVCVFAGRLTRDPETREVGEFSVTSFSLAVQNDYKNKKTNEYDVNFFDFQCWGKQGETIEKYFSKGEMMLVKTSGRQDSWDDKETGKKRNKVFFNVESFDFISKRGEKQESNTESATFASADSGVEVDVEDGVPF